MSPDSELGPTSFHEDDVEEELICAYYKGPGVTLDSSSPTGSSVPPEERLRNNGTAIVCESPREFCFAFWQENENSTFKSEY